MTMASNPPPVLPQGPGNVRWKVTSQRQTTMSDGNTFVPAVIVGFQTAGGNFGNVTIVASEYPQKVAMICQAAADAMDGVSGLGTLTVP